MYSVPKGEFFLHNKVEIIDSLKSLIVDTDTDFDVYVHSENVSWIFMSVQENGSLTR